MDTSAQSTIQYIGLSMRVAPGHTQRFDHRLLSTLMVATVLLLLAVVRWMATRSKAAAATILQLEELRHCLAQQRGSLSRSGGNLRDQGDTT